MIKITMIFGEDAVRKYDESKELPSEEWLMDNRGCRGRERVQNS